MTDAKKWPPRWEPDIFEYDIPAMQMEGSDATRYYDNTKYFDESDVKPLLELYEACKAVYYIHADSTESEYELWCRWDKAMDECRKREEEHA